MMQDASSKSSTRILQTLHCKSTGVCLELNHHRSSEPTLHQFIPTIVMSSGLPWQNDTVQQMAFEICFLICFWFRIHPFPKLPKPEHARTEWTAIAAVELDCLDLNSRKNWNPTSGVQIVQTRLDLWCASAVHACGRHFLIQFVCICLCRCARINSVAASESLVRHLFMSIRALGIANIWNPNLSRKARAPRRWKLPKALRIISLHCSNMFKQNFITHHLQDPLSLCSISQTAVGCESTGPPCSTLWMVPLSWHCSTILQSHCSSSLSTCFEKKEALAGWDFNSPIFIHFPCHAGYGKYMKIKEQGIRNAPRRDPSDPSDPSVVALVTVTSHELERHGPAAAALQATRLPQAVRGASTWHWSKTRRNVKKNCKIVQISSSAVCWYLAVCNSGLICLDLGLICGVELYRSH